MHSKQYEQATICFDEAQKMGVNQNDSILVFYTYYYQGKLYFKNREKTNGAEACLNALKYYPFAGSGKYPYSLLKVAECYLYNKKFEEANDCYSELQQKLEDKQDSTLTAKMLFKAGRNSRNKDVKNEISAYLKNNFEKDSSTMVYSKLARAEIYLRGNKPDSAGICLDEIPLKFLSEIPEILLQLQTASPNSDNTSPFWDFIYPFSCFSCRGYEMGYKPCYFVAKTCLPTSPKSIKKVPQFFEIVGLVCLLSGFVQSYQRRERHRNNLSNHLYINISKL